MPRIGGFSDSKVSAVYPSIDCLASSKISTPSLRIGCVSTGQASRLASGRFMGLVHLKQGARHVGRRPGNPAIEHETPQK